MSAVFSRAATRSLASTSASTSAPIQKKMISTTSKRPMPLYFYSDHKPIASTSSSSSRPHSHEVQNTQRIHSISGDFNPTQHAFDPPPSSKAAAAGWSFESTSRRAYRPAVEEYDYMNGSASYGIDSGVVKPKSKSKSKSK